MYDCANDSLVWLSLVSIISNTDNRHFVFRTEDASDSFMTESPSLSGFRSGLRIATPPNGVGHSAPPERLSGRHQGQEWVAQAQARENQRQAEWAQAQTQATTRPDHLPSTNQPTITDKSTLKVYLPNGGFNVVKFGDATDIKVIVIKLFVLLTVTGAIKSSPVNSLSCLSVCLSYFPPYLKALRRIFYLISILPDITFTWYQYSQTNGLPSWQHLLKYENEIVTTGWNWVQIEWSFIRVPLFVADKGGHVL